MGHPMYLDITRHRDLWERIYALTEKLSSSMGRLYGLCNLYTYLALFVSVYCTVSQYLTSRNTIWSPKFAGLLVSVIYIGTHAYSFCNSAQYLEEEITDEVRYLLLNIRMHTLSATNAREVS